MFSLQVFNFYLMSWSTYSRTQHTRLGLYNMSLDSLIEFFCFSGVGGMDSCSQPKVAGL